MDLRTRNLSTRFRSSRVSIRAPRRSLRATLVVVAAFAAVAACGLTESSDDATDVGDVAPGAAEPDARSDFEEGSGFSVGGEAAEEEAADSMAESDESRVAAADSDDAAGAPDVGSDDGAVAGEDGSVGAGTGDEVEGRPLTAAEIGRDIILTGWIEARVDDVDVAGAAAVEAITDLGGFVFGQNSVGGSEPRSEIVFKVLPEDFDEAMAELSGVGELVNRSITADDVTERVVDLESRIEVTELGVLRLREALEETETLEEFAEIEAQLLAREADLEVMRAQLRTIQDRVDLATITLVLSQDRVENNVELVVTAYEEHDDGESCNGTDDFRIDEGVDMTLCFEIVNLGDQALGDLSITAPVLDLEDGGLIPVFGGLDSVLEPGQSIVMAHELTPERDLNPRIRVSATPVDPEGEVEFPSVSVVRNITIDVVEKPDEAGFSDGFEAGKRIVAGAWTAVTVVAGLLVPLLVFVPIIAALVWISHRLLQRQRARRADRRAGLPEQPAPTDPPPPAAGSEERLSSQAPGSGDTEAASDDAGSAEASEAP